MVDLRTQNRVTGIFTQMVSADVHGGPDVGLSSSTVAGAFNHHKMDAAWLWWE